MIIEDIKNFFRRRSLRKLGKPQHTGIIPLSDVHSAVAFIDAEDTQYDECKASLMSFFRENKIKGDIYFMDLRPIKSKTRLITSINTTILKKDLNWYGRPSKEKINLLLGTAPDLFISLFSDNSYTMEYLAKCSNARFKVGRVQLPGDTFDLIVQDHADKPLSQKESFEAMKPYLKLIQKG